eukprot:GHVP01055460.1.p1 GENE.GHVP01055460.1~~GHVP01055460.1.p1  ORF type:complete len:217 (+),score=47.07 GHVP01055460.1:474-1124(+)
MKEEESDAILSQVTDSFGGINNLFDNFFGFLRRKTDLFTNGGNEARELIEAHFQRELEKYTKDNPGTYIKEIDEPKTVSSTPQRKSKDSLSDLTETKNGGVTDRYAWSQVLASVEVQIGVEPNTSAKDLIISIEKHSISVFLKQLNGKKKELVSGDLHQEIVADESTWSLVTLAGKRVLQLDLEKVDKMRWWSCVVKGDPEIDTSKVTPENCRWRR